MVSPWEGKKTGLRPDGLCTREGPVGPGLLGVGLELGLNRARNEQAKWAWANLWLMGFELDKK